jgi:acyl-CoA synthetase (NDP forming)
VRAVVDGDVAGILEQAHAEGRSVLLDTEGFALAGALGFRVPAHRFVQGADEARATSLDDLPGDRLVVKVASPQILHKTDVGGIEVVPHDRSAVGHAIETILQRVGSEAVSGFTVSEFVPHNDALGAELLVGLRWTDEFGPVVTIGAGGIHAEQLARHLAPGSDVAILAPGLAPPAAISAALERTLVGPLVTGAARGARVRLPPERLHALAKRMLEFAAQPESALLAEFEINPLALTDDGPVALDVLVTLRRDSAEPRAARPLEKLGRLLKPSSVALIGVSEGTNPGRVILGNMLREGFPREQIAIVKPNADAIGGVACYPNIAALPERVDLLVLSIAAEQTPAAIEQIIDGEKAECVIVIPGGLGERSGTEPLAQRVERALEGARGGSWDGPLINGGNCLGVRSVPGRYDTMFIPGHKLSWPRSEPSPLALVSQSGAFAVARSSKLARLNPRYVISVGNQIDLTVGDYLNHFEDDPGVEVVACYIEGFRPLDGRRWLESAARIVESGRSVVLYGGGRTDAGALATASHTAAVAGDYAVLRELARQAGVLVADTLADFEDLVRLSCFLRDREPSGSRLGAITNAGFECVAIADNLGRFTLPRFESATTAVLAEILARRRLERVIEVRNPVDLTPIMDDAPYEDAVRAVLWDDNVDVAVVGCVPHTGALNTLAAGEGHGEDVGDAASIAGRLAGIRRESPKPWVAVVDAGPKYDAMAELLEDEHIPTFRTADRAVRLFETYTHNRLGLKK